MFVLILCYIIFAMNITRLNFKDKLPYMKQVIDRCHYFALDLEMSGTDVSERIRNSALDATQSRYLKLKHSIQLYLPLQLGLCGFQKLNDNQIIAYPFNIFMFPFSLSQGDISKNFGFSTKSIRFLANHNFDFNKLFYNGVPYLSLEQFNFYQGESQIKKIKKQLKIMDAAVTPDMEAFKKANENTIQEWMNSENKELQIDIEHIRYNVYSYLLDSIKKKYPNIQIFDTYDQQQRFGRASLFLHKEKPQNFKQYQEKKYENIDELKDLPLLISELSNSKKPLIVHNGTLDLMHTMHRFFGRLPPTISQFKKSLLAKFPTIYDTKVLTNFSPILFNKLKFRNSLSDCFHLLKQKPDPQIKIAEGFSGYTIDSNSQYHEAGFDAFATGIVCFKAWKQLEKLSMKQGTNFQDIKKHLANKMLTGGSTNNLDLTEGEDNYKGGEQAYYLQQVIPSPVLQSEIHNFFQQKYGKINLFPISNIYNHYNFTFQRQNSDHNLQQELESSGGMILITIGSSKFLMFDENNYQKYLKGIQVTIE